MRSGGPLLVCLRTALILSLTTCDTHTGPESGLTVYEHPDFGGDSRTFQSNAWDLSDVSGPCNTSSGSNGDWDDCISSLRITPGLEATVHPDDDYQGGSLTVSQDIRDLKDVMGPCRNGWDDCISSLTVFPAR